MPRGVPGRKLENNSAVTEYVVIAVEHHRAGMGERRIERHVRAIRVGAEHEVTLRLLRQPGRARIVVGVADVIGMSV